jgi:hypothetical protein
MMREKQTQGKSDVFIYLSQHGDKRRIWGNSRKPQAS